jgi:RNA polymerase sigma-70 factor (ECF subfamily)
VIEKRTDEQLCAALVEGDERALATLHARHAGHVHASARRRLRDATRADDLVQDVFLDVWRSAPRFDRGRASFGTWLRTIAARRITDYERRASVRPALANFEGPESGTPDPVDETVQRLDVAAALAALPETQRSTLRLAFFDGLTYAEIAERTRTPLGTIKSRALLGMHRLEDQLRPVSDVAPSRT